MNPDSLDVVTITLNPAIDRTAVIPGFAAGAVNRVEAEEDHPGGKGVNVASALADYGLHAGVTGFLGRENAESFEALFARKNIEDHFVRVAGRTRVGIKITDALAKQTTDINFPGASPAPADLATLRETLARLNSPWWVVAGSIPPGVEAGVYREIIAALKARGARVALDASGEALRHALDAGPDVVKPNVSELAALLGRPLSGVEAVVRAARGLLAKGIELAAVSMGAEGACFVTATEAVIARPPEVQVRSTVGAGDAMVAGIVAARIRGLSLGNCARLATAFSLEALGRVESGISSPSEVEQRMGEVAVQRLGSRFL